MIHVQKRNHQHMFFFYQCGFSKARLSHHHQIQFEDLLDRFPANLKEKKPEGSSFLLLTIITCSGRRPKPTDGVWERFINLSGVASSATSSELQDYQMHTFELVEV